MTDEITMLALESLKLKLETDRLNAETELAKSQAWALLMPLVRPVVQELAAFLLATKAKDAIEP